jgi:hypothetical protein
VLLKAVVVRAGIDDGNDKVFIEEQPLNALIIVVTAAKPVGSVKDVNE